MKQGITVSQLWCIDKCIDNYFFIFLKIFYFNRTDHRVNKVGTVGPIAEANMRDFERKKRKQEKQITNKKQKQIEWNKKNKNTCTWKQQQIK